MTSQGSPYARFRRALDTGNLTLVRAAAEELPYVELTDALRVCVLLRGAEPESYERAVVRWLGRFCLERGATLAEVYAAVGAFRALPRATEAGLRRLDEICR